jgi:hypothetical protein
MACELHTAYLYDRGGLTRIGEIAGMTSISWERVGDDISFCDITLTTRPRACADLLEQMEPPGTRSWCSGATPACGRGR